MKFSAYGHFGRKPTNKGIYWEKTDKIDHLKCNLENLNF